MTQSREDRKQVFYKWIKNNPKKVKAIRKRCWQKKQAKKVAFYKAHPELYHQNPSGIWTKNVPEEVREKRRLRASKYNAIYQKSKKGGEIHNRVAREYARRKSKKLKWIEEFDKLYGDDFEGGFKDKIKSFISIQLDKMEEYFREANKSL